MSRMCRRGHAKLRSNTRNRKPSNGTGRRNRHSPVAAWFEMILQPDTETRVLKVDAVRARLKDDAVVAYGVASIYMPAPCQRACFGELLNSRFDCEGMTTTWLLA